MHALFKSTFNLPFGYPFLLLILNACFPKISFLDRISSNKQVFNKIVSRSLKLSRFPTPSNFWSWKTVCTNDLFSAQFEKQTKPNYSLNRRNHQETLMSQSSAALNTKMSALAWFLFLWTHMGNSATFIHHQSSPLQSFFRNIRIVFIQFIALLRLYLNSKQGSVASGYI